MEHTDIKVANSRGAVLQWAHSTKLSVVAITNYKSILHYSFLPNCRGKFKLQILEKKPLKFI